MIIDNDLTFLSFLNLNGENNKKCNLYSTTEGFIKGNMFENLYNTYKDYKAEMPKTTCEKTAKLYKIMELEFAINDLNLYLDINPNDEEVFSYMKSIIEKLCICQKEYVEKYGPIEVNENTGSVNEWVKNLPWEKEDSLYV